MKPKRPRNTPLVRPKAFELTIYGSRHEDGSVWWFPFKPEKFDLTHPDAVVSNNVVFHDCLRLDAIEPSCVVWRSISHRRRWASYPSSALEMLRHPEYAQGVLCAHFIFEKKGRFHGIRLAKEAEVWWWEHHERSATPTEGTTAT